MFGNVRTATCPNITGWEVAWASTINGAIAAFDRSASGAFYTTTASAYTANAQLVSARPAITTDQTVINISAENSSNLYGQSNTAQPPAFQILMIIKI